MCSQTFKDRFEMGKYQESLDMMLKMGDQGIQSSITEYEQILCLYYQLRSLIKLGKYKSSLHLVKKAMENVASPQKDFFIVVSTIVRLHALTKLGRIDEALEVSSECSRIFETFVLSEHQEEKYWRALFDDAKGLVFCYKNELDAALRHFQRSLKIFDQIGNNYDIAASLNNLGIVYLQKGKFDLALSYFQRSLKIFDQIGNNYDIAASLSNIGLVYWQKGDLNTALDHFQQSLKLRETIGNKQDIAKALGNIGLIYWQQGVLNSALEYCQGSLKLFEVSGNDKDIAYSLANISNIYFDKGELKKALESDYKCLEIFKKIGSKQEIAMSFSNIGLIFQHKGELNNALDYYQQSLDINEIIGNKATIAADLSNIGLIYLYKGEFNNALKYFKNSLKIREEIGNDIETAETVFQLVRLSLEQEEQSQGQYYLFQLNRLNQRSPNKRIKLFNQLAKALVVNQNKNIEDIAQANKIFQQIIQEEIISHNLTIFARLNLCQNLFKQFILNGKQKILEELEKQLAVILSIAEQGNLQGIILAIWLLQGKLELLRLKIPNARSFFQRVKEEGYNRGYSLLQQQADDELEELHSYITMNLVLEMQEVEQDKFHEQQTQRILIFLKNITSQYGFSEE